ncbi:MAG TPA: endonuclease [Mycobacteriales bacterium]
MSRSADRIAALLDRSGQTFAAEAGIAVRDEPQPLYRLLVLTLLLSKPIGADLAVAAARELRGWHSPEAMLAATWQQRVDALVRAHYRRYDESTSTRLEQNAQWLQDECGGDLRRLVVEDAAQMEQRLQDAPGLGPTGARIFLREVQVAWPWLRPYADQRVLDAARAAGLPHTVRGLANAAGTDDLSAVGAALIREAA